MNSAANCRRGDGALNRTGALTGRSADSVVRVTVDAVSPARLFDDTVQQGAGMAEPFAVTANCIGIL